jgi:hypothetical protein
LVALSSAALFLLLNPVVQPFSLGALDSALRSRWETRAREANFPGLTEKEVLDLFGEPCRRRNEAPIVCGAEGCRESRVAYAAWDYAPIPFFWLSHADHFKVFFEHGRATSYRRGD